MQTGQQEKQQELHYDLFVSLLDIRINKLRVGNGLLLPARMVQQF